jgi:IMP cyclohydrolase
MVEALENLAKMEYPGRVIIIGCSPEKDTIILYAITGRSPSSQARRLEIEEDYGKVIVKPTDKEILKKGMPDLLVYPALSSQKEGIAVSNGKQTEDIEDLLEEWANPVDVLTKALAKWEYEPDEPNYTPRISGCVIFDEAALSIIKRADDGSAMRQYFTVPRILGKGKMISTYAGVNEKPLSSFQGGPIDVGLPWTDVKQAIDAMYEALAPKQGQPDFRVAVAGVYVDEDGIDIISVKNRYDLERGD